MTTALEQALLMEQEKFAAEHGGGAALTPMQAGYVDALAKLGYAIKEANPPGAPAPPAAPGVGNVTRSQMRNMDPAKRQAMVAAKKKQMAPTTFKSQVQRAKGLAAPVPGAPR